MLNCNAKLLPEIQHLQKTHLTRLIVKNKQSTKLEKSPCHENCYKEKMMRSMHRSGTRLEFEFISWMLMAHCP